MALYLVRHGVAVGRSIWDGDDVRRPLTAKGERQAQALVRLLAGSDVRRIHSSPAARCHDTVVPLAEQRGLDIHDTAVLVEGGAGREATALVVQLAAKKGDTVLCTHGDLIPEILRRLVRDGLDLESELQFAKGSTWELLTHDGTLRSARYHPAAEWSPRTTEDA